jgi:PHS family inorganic phosphate transporter-like MFS transporter
VFGQVVMGMLGDLLGRNKAMLITLALAGTSALGSAVLPNGDADSVYTLIIACRFTLGIGMGGVYPLAATKAAEDAAAAAADDDDDDDDDIINSRSVRSNAVDTSSVASSYFWQGPGAMAPWLVGLLMTYNQALDTDTRWRLLLGLGSIPSGLMVLVSWWEARLSSAAAAADADADANITGGGEDVGDSAKMALLSSSAAAASHSRWNDDTNGTNGHGGGGDECPHQANLWHILSTRKYQRKLLATGLGWFLYDICFFGTSLFGGQILNSIGSENDDDVTSDRNIRDVSIKQLIALGTAIPAMYLTNVLLRYTSTRNIQVYGFFFIALMFLLLALLVAPLENHDTALFGIYCVLLFALNSGPCVSTYVLPSETYPSHIRSTCTGISAAMGKLGAVAGAYIFGSFASNSGFATTFVVSASVAIAGAAVGCVFIENKSRSADGGLTIIASGDSSSGSSGGDDGDGDVRRTRSASSEPSQLRDSSMASASGAPAVSLPSLDHHRKVSREAVI